MQGRKGWFQVLLSRLFLEYLLIFVSDISQAIALGSKDMAPRKFKKLRIGSEELVPGTNPSNTSI